MDHTKQCGCTGLEFWHLGGRCRKIRSSKLHWSTRDPVLKKNPKSKKIKKLEKQRSKLVYKWQRAIHCCHRSAAWVRSSQTDPWFSLRNPALLIFSDILKTHMWDVRKLWRILTNFSWCFMLCHLAEVCCCCSFLLSSACVKVTPVDFYAYQTILHEAHTFKYECKVEPITCTC